MGFDHVMEKVSLRHLLTMVADKETYNSDLVSCPPTSMRCRRVTSFEQNQNF